MSNVPALASLSPVAAPVSKVTPASLRKATTAANAAASATLESMSSATGSVFFVSPDALTIEAGYNVRTFDPANKDDSALMRSISVEGVSVPLTVREDAGTFYVVAGHRRLGAVRAILAKGANKRVASVPVILSSARLSPTDRLYDLIESNTGKPLSMLESGVVCARLIEAGQDRKAMARRLGVTARQIGNMLHLAYSPDDIRAALQAERIAGTMVYEYCQKVGDAAVAYTHILGALGKVKAPGKVTLKDVLAFAASVQPPATDDAEGEGEGEGEGDGSSPAKPAAGKAIKLALADVATVTACLALIAKPGPAPAPELIAAAADLLARLMPAT